MEDFAMNGGDAVLRVFCLVMAISMMLSGAGICADELDMAPRISLIPLPESSPAEIPFTASKTENEGGLSDTRLSGLQGRLKHIRRVPGTARRPKAARQTVSNLSYSQRARLDSKAHAISTNGFGGKKSLPRGLMKFTPAAVAALTTRDGGDETSTLPRAGSLVVNMRPIGTPRQIKVPGRRDTQKSASETAYPAEVARDDRDERTVRAFLRDTRSHLRIDDPDNELSLHRKETDNLSRRHYRFKQQFNGLPVWPSEMIVHLAPDGSVDLVDGAFVPTPRKLTTQPVVREDVAIAVAREHVIDGGNGKSGQPELIIYGAVDQPARLAWKVELGVSTDSHWIVVVDAVTGKVLTAFNTVQHENVSGAGPDLFGTTRSLNIWHENSIFYLIDTSKQMYDQSSNPPQPNTTRGAISILDARNQPATSQPRTNPSLYFITSSTTGAGWLKDGVSAAYNFSKVYDYYLARHNRNSINGQSGNISAIVRYGQNYSNAFWSNELNAMYFGDAMPFAGALDVVGHEMTHGITSNTANLVYHNQSGALNEAFSDIFGEMVEAYSAGGPDWLIGAQLGKALRSFPDPGSISSRFGPYPSKMSQYYKLSDTSDYDYGGVHINSSIINHAFYLLATGMSGAIGLTDAERIFYRALTTHLTMQSEFLDARLACVQSAKELFGATSTQAVKTAEAFDAVEIYESAATPAPAPGPSINTTDSTIFVSFDPDYGFRGGNRLARRETALGDGNLGSWLSDSAINPTRPSVTADGSLAAFVKADNDFCMIYTNDDTSENCLGYPGLVHSVAMSPDGERYGFVLLDASGAPENKITVIDLVTEKTQTYPLVAPASEGVSIDSIQYADTMAFTSNSRFLVYDALNVMKLADGSDVGAWSIYAIDLLTGETLVLVPPKPGLDIAYPAIGHTSDSFITFEGFSQATNQSTIYAGNTRTGQVAVVGSVDNDYGVPCYTGDDTAIIYSAPDTSQPTGHTLYKRLLGADHMTPDGSPAAWLQDADYAAIYRRGAYYKLTVNNNDTASGTVTSNAGGITCGDSCSYIYPSGTTVTLTARPYTGAVFGGWGGACSGTGACTVNLDSEKSITASFHTAANPINGSCGSDNGKTLVSPPTNLCAAGTAGSVTGSGPWYWSCAGSNGGSDANCGASRGTAESNFIVSATGSAGAIVSPASQTVATGRTAVFTIALVPGYHLVSVTGCNGALSGGTYSATITGSCVVSVQTAKSDAAFSETAYLAANPDIARAVRAGSLSSGWRHYSNWGSREGRLLAPEGYGDFDENAYLAANPDIAQAVRAGSVLNGWQHYSNWGKKEGRPKTPSGYSNFDENSYLAANPDIAQAVKSGILATGWQHYSRWGMNEKRSLCPMDYGSFSEQGYLAANPDIANAVRTGGLLSGWWHYREWGWKEGRQLMPDGYVTFNEAAYLAANPGIDQAVKTGTFSSGWQHYNQAGKTEGRQLFPAGYATFSEPAYLAANLDIARAVRSGTYLNGWRHYSAVGNNEGRPLNPSDYGSFDEADYLAANPDVFQALLNGMVDSGWAHYRNSGKREGRLLKPVL